jgi:hypothetical protein
MSSNTLRTVRLLRFPLLLAAALALAYGVWSAVIDAAGPNRLIVPTMLDHTAKVELYYDAGEGLRQEDSVSEIVTASEELTDVAFPVPRVPLRAVRFDPMDGAGHFTLGQPRLETASGRFVAKFPMSAIAPANQIADFKIDGKRWIGTTVPEANDPQLTFQLGAPLRVGAPRIPWIEGAILLLIVYLSWRFQGPAAVVEPTATEPAAETKSES